MKALVFNGPRKIRYESFDDPTIRDERNLIIKVKRCSICGSDLHMYHGDRIAKTDYSQPIERFCTGHETIGEVVEVGSAVRRHKVGDKVLVAGGAGCGICRRCLAGQFNLCESYRSGGHSSIAYGIRPVLNGGHAEYLEVINADLGATGIPEGITDQQALLLTDALATGYYGVKMSGVSPGDTVAVIGQGPVGRLAAEAAVAIGASTVYAIDPQENRRNMASAFGATPLHPDEAVQTVYEETRGLGVDSVIEAVGVGPTLSQAVKLARIGGRLSILGILQADTNMPLHIIQAKSLVVHMGIAGVVDSWPELIPLLQTGRIRGEGVFTHSFDLAEGEEAYRMFDAREDGVMKVLLTP
ncbi:MAG: theronine dehydrogenase [Haliea sp.]|uniref:zinc-binding dehydrogenase n=1 Tax=Haliea sp. TaxID=1932666 RepID=UPI000C4B6C3A|nr:alcohol dehydrogenase catalytic domain-containing protein [Haliea sp.]MBM68503.1 theronine dehydrogenase [Haliea sp.]|tara:strand:- start:87169 stop:88236 length:1068 start_codon:yes stop_codon:yes gene_type:complete